MFKRKALALLCTGLFFILPILSHAYVVHEDEIPKEGPTFPGPPAPGDGTLCASRISWDPETGNEIDDPNNPDVISLKDKLPFPKPEEVSYTTRPGGGDHDFIPGPDDGDTTSYKNVTFFDDVEQSPSSNDSWIEEVRTQYGPDMASLVMAISDDWMWEWESDVKDSNKNFAGKMPLVRDVTIDWSGYHGYARDPEPNEDPRTPLLHHKNKKSPQEKSRERAKEYRDKYQPDIPRC